MNSPTALRRQRSTIAIIAFGIFLVFAATMACLAGAMLLYPRTPLDGLWVLNPRGHRDLAPLGKRIGVPFLLLAVTLSVSAFGWFRKRPWGWRLAVAILAIQVFGDFVNLFLGHFLEGMSGAAIAGALLFYILRPRVRAVFGLARNRS
jgi:hypothetical protein